MRRGVRQYVVLGAGLDTFAYRDPFLRACTLPRVEVDHPAHGRRSANAYVRQASRFHRSSPSVDVPHFERQSLTDRLRAKAGSTRFHRRSSPGSGVTMYLTNEAIDSTLAFIASRPREVGSSWTTACPPRR